MQYVTDGRQKYIWFSGSGVEQFFDLEIDPQEMVNRIDDDACAEDVTRWRNRLIAELRGRPEGFSDGERLVPGSAPD